MDRSTHDGADIGGPGWRPADASAEGSCAELIVRLPGRFASAGSGEAGCLLTRLNGRVGRVATEGERLIEGVRVVIYLDLVGRIEGAVTSADDGSFSLRIAAPSAKWQRLVRQFEVLAQMPRAAVDDLRCFRRIAPKSPETTMTRAGGEVFSSLIENLSRSGAAVLVGAALDLGELVRVGSTLARVVRHIEGGVAVQFLRLLPLETFGPSYRP